MKLSKISEAFTGIKTKIDKAAYDSNRSAKQITLIAVSKQQQEDRIEASLTFGQRVFGENRVQEACKRWTHRKTNYPDLRLHLIGPLQSNKAADAVRLFDVIHTVDRPRLVRSIAKESQAVGRCPKLLVQVNTGEEEQKAGVLPGEVEALVSFIREENLPLAGLMCIPPVDDAPAGHFAFLKRLADDLELPWVSMGMSGDYQTAVELGATHVRVGSAIFGARPPLTP